MIAPPKDLESIAIAAGGVYVSHPSGQRIAFDAPALFELYRQVAAHVEAGVAVERVHQQSRGTRPAS